MEKWEKYLCPTLNEVRSLKWILLSEGPSPVHYGNVCQNPPSQNANFCQGSDL